MNQKKRLIIGISGATGAIYGVRMLEILSKIDEIETHLVMSKAGRIFGALHFVHDQADEVGRMLHGLITRVEAQQSR